VEWPLVDQNGISEHFCMRTHCLTLTAVVVNRQLNIIPLGV